MIKGKHIITTMSVFGSSYSLFENRSSLDIPILLLFYYIACWMYISYNVISYTIDYWDKEIF